MMSKLDKHPVIWPLEPHTAAKHEILRRYLQAWFAIMQRWNKRLIYIDGFAGPGVYEGGEPGSPLVALSALLEHNAFDGWKTEFIFVFCEAEPQRYDSLVSQLDDVELPENVKVEVVDEPFDDVARQIIESLGGKRMAPALLFIDPFGLKGVSMETVAEMVNNPKCEVMVNLAVKNAARFTDHEYMEEHFDDLYGDDRWREVLDLDVGDRAEPLLRLYQDSLHDHCEFDLTWSFSMINRGLSYYLVFATTHITGLNAMKDAMWKVDETGQFEFSSQLGGADITLDAPAAQADILQDELAEHFAGQTVTIDDVEEFVLRETPFRKAHVRRHGLTPLEKADHIEVDRPGAHGFPDGTEITFAD